MMLIRRLGPDKGVHTSRELYVGSRCLCTPACVLQTTAGVVKATDSDCAHQPLQNAEQLGWKVYSLHGTMVGTPQRLRYTEDLNPFQAAANATVLVHISRQQIKC